MNLMMFLPMICGVTAANMYYIQPLVPLVQDQLNVSYAQAGMLYSFSLAGNFLSLFFVIPLGDFFNKKTLIMIFYLGSVASLFVFYLCDNYYCLSFMAFLIGAGAAAIPLIVAGVSNDKNGSAYIGRIMAGVLLGILLSRFASSEIGALYGWKSIYLIAAFAMLASCAFMYFFYPSGMPARGNGAMTYLEIIKSSVLVAFRHPLAGFYCVNGFAAMFVFAAFWSNVSMYLTNAFDLNQYEIGLFSLVGAAGAASAYFSSSILRKINYSNKPLCWSMAASLLIMAFYPDALWCAVAGAILIDAFIQLLHVNNQKKLYASCKGNESQAASCYMTCFVIGGAAGGLMASSIYAGYGWRYVLMLCAAVSLAALYPSAKEHARQRAIDAGRAPRNLR